jgi:hypothetical protein
MGGVMYLHYIARRAVVGWETRKRKHWDGLPCGYYDQPGCYGLDRSICTGYPGGPILGAVKTSKNFS